MMSINLNGIAILNANGSHYRFIIISISKSNTVILVQTANSIEE